MGLLGEVVNNAFAVLFSFVRAKPAHSDAAYDGVEVIPFDPAIVLQKPPANTGHGPSFPVPSGQEILL